MCTINIWFWFILFRAYSRCTSWLCFMKSMVTLMAIYIGNLTRNKVCKVNILCFFSSFLNLLKNSRKCVNYCLATIQHSTTISRKWQYQSSLHVSFNNRVFAIHSSFVLNELDAFRHLAIIFPLECINLGFDCIVFFFHVWCRTFVVTTTIHLEFLPSGFLQTIFEHR